MGTQFTLVDLGWMFHMFRWDMPAYLVCQVRWANMGSRLSPFCKASLHEAGLSLYFRVDYIGSIESGSIMFCEVCVLQMRAK